jgi:hypothetical protein
VGFLFCNLFNYLTTVESLTTSVAFDVELQVLLQVELQVAFSVAVFSPQEVIREIVVKIVRHTNTNFFIFL